MSTKLHHYFVPSAENNYHPHILHTKRAIFYGLVSLVCKAIVVVFVILLPEQAYLHPDILAAQHEAIVALTNKTRQAHQVPALSVAPKLDVSALRKADDMAIHQYFSHNGPEGRNLAYFLNEAGYNFTVAGENLAMGFTDAPAVVNAWLKSPEHYANVVDRDFTEFGLGLVSGFYRGESIVYVAEHFGSRVIESLAVADDQPKVLGVKIAMPTVEVNKSWLYWLENDGQTTLLVRARMQGVVQSAQVAVGSYTIPLTGSVSTSSLWAGQITVPGTAAQFANPLALPILSVINNQGVETKVALNWFALPASAPSVWADYNRAKQLFWPLTNLFAVTHSIYAGLLVFFSLALFVSIVVEIRRQHYHIIGQTLVLLLVIGGLWLV